MELAPRTESAEPAPHAPTAFGRVSWLAFAKKPDADDVAELQRVQGSDAPSQGGCDDTRDGPAEPRALAEALRRSAASLQTGAVG
jgi:hypothetical protein